MAGAWQVNWAQPRGSDYKSDPVGAYQRGAALAQRREEFEAQREDIQRERDAEARRAASIQTATRELTFLEGLQRMDQNGIEGHKYVNVAAGATMKYMRDNGIDEQPFPDVDLTSQESIGAEARTLRAHLTALQGAEKGAQWEQMIADRVAENLEDPSYYDMAMARRDTREWGKARRQIAEESLAMKKAGASRLTVNNDLTTSTKSKLQQDEVDFRGTIGELEYASEIIGGDANDLFGAYPRAKRLGVKIADFMNMGEHVSPEMRDQYNRMNDIKVTLGGINLKMVHKFFGGALTESEIRRMKNRIIDEKMSPMQVRDTMMSMVRQLKRGSAVRQRIMREGTLAEGTSAFKKAMRSEFKAQTERDIEAEFVKMRVENPAMSEEQIFQAIDYNERAER